MAAPGATCCSLLLLLQLSFSAALQAQPLLSRASQQEEYLVSLPSRVLQGLVICVAHSVKMAVQYQRGAFGMQGWTRRRWTAS